ncbi:Tim44/TimA family putative adaptor protein [Lichenicola sp.]|uniref:Tim44/TimA family putative adaptor protein n=1 Tax=Lichenicola sp. TaxID=2804529 RepID=UPI003AFFF680
MNPFAGNSPVALVLIGLVAAFLVLRLRSVLGKRTGLERPAPPPGMLRGTGPIIEARAEPIPAVPDRKVPDGSSPIGVTLARIRERERGFDPADFLLQAEAAFRRIVQAFAEGDRAALRTNLTPDAYGAFEAAIIAREEAGQTQRAEIRAITQAQIVDASLSQTNGTWRAVLDVRFVSDQVSVLLAKDGLPVSGADAVTELADLWSFERWIGGPRPSDANTPPWRLAAARSA